jgi:hypothetical protein
MPCGVSARGASLWIGNGEQQIVTGGNTVTWETVTVEGADGLSRSTYSILGSLLVTGPGSPASVDLSDQGLLNIAAGGTATATGYAQVTTGATLQIDGSASFFDGVFAYDGGEVTIGAAGSMSGASLYLSGVGAFARTAGGAYSIFTLSLADNATADLTSADTISGDVLVDSGGTLTLATDLSVLTAALYLSGGGAISRTTQSISVGTLDVNGDTSFSFAASDTVGAAVLHGGAQATAGNPLSLTGLTISGSSAAGSSSSLTTSDTLSITSAGSILVSDGGRLFAAGGILGDGATTINVTGDSSRLVVAGASGIDTTSIASGGVLETTAGLFATDTLSLSGPGAFVRTGGSYGVGHVQLDGTSLGYTAADTIAVEAALTNGASLDIAKNLALSGQLLLDGGSALTRSTGTETVAAAGLFISGASSFAIATGDSFSMLDLATGGNATVARALALNSLTIDASGSTLTLQTFDGAIGQLSWGLRVAGDRQSLLASYLTGGRILHGATPQPVTAIYDLATYGNVTFVGYVTPVPEPSTLAMVVLAIAGIAGAKRATCR